MKVGGGTDKILEGTIDIPRKLHKKHQEEEAKLNSNKNLENSNVLLASKTMQGAIFQAPLMNSCFGIINKRDFPKYGISAVTLGDWLRKRDLL